MPQQLKLHQCNGVCGGFHIVHADPSESVLSHQPLVLAPLPAGTFFLELDPSQCVSGIHQEWSLQCTEPREIFKLKSGSRIQKM